MEKLCHGVGPAIAIYKIIAKIAASRYKVQACDATMLHSTTSAWLKKINLLSGSHLNQGEPPSF
ncbi:MAG: hypothetical protein ABJC98_06920, partial [Bacteroidota bacterium]